LIALSPLVPAVASAAWTPVAVLIAVGAKRIFVGRYVPERVPVWGGRYFRTWIMRQVIRIVPCSRTGC
jgi:hypothetical protein